MTPTQTSPDVLAMPDAEVLFYSDCFSPAESAELFQTLMESIQWKQDNLNLYGKTIAVPRLTAWYGDTGNSYTYSGIAQQPLPWTATLLTIKTQVEAAAGVPFNSVLLNQYRDGADSVAWHSDDEPELGANPVIASVSFGATRVFQFKHKHDSDQRLSLELTPGSLLLMRGATQHFWKHQIPKTKKLCGPRINLTFRVIYR
jgi:alkylated DNA repair dioxygenase AlkB